MKMNKTNEALISEELRAAAHPVRREDLRRGAELMAAAFSGDPSIRYLLGGESAGTSDWRYFLCVLKALYGKCVMLADGGDMTALLILFPPRLKCVPALSFFMSGGLGLHRFFGLPLYARSVNYEDNCRRVKEKFMTRETWYCMCFVVRPDMQGRGVGSRLIRPALAVLESHGAPVYLETHKAVNTRIYAHLGFHTVDTCAIPGTGITQYAMLRPARQPLR